MTSFAPRDHDFLMEGMGDSVRAFIRNLNTLHLRLTLVFPKYPAARFESSNETDSSIDVTYRSDTAGMAPFLEGCLMGVGDKFDTPVTVAVLTSRANGDFVDALRVAW